MAKAKKAIELSIPAPLPPKNWLVVGIDPSMSRTGYAIMEVQERAAAWADIGSVKPRVSSDAVWIRGKAMALFLRKVIEDANTLAYAKHSSWTDQNTGLLISMEYPTPRNDYLVALNRILHMVFFEEQSTKQAIPRTFADVRVLTTNAATLRSLMGLTQTGAKNKTENIARAYDFISQSDYPGLDTDACDAVLLAMMGRYAASIVMGHPSEVPERFLTTLCDATQVEKGNGRNKRVITKGILHRPEYWYPYKPNQYELAVKDARIPRARTLGTSSVSI